MSVIRQTVHITNSRTLLREIDGLSAAFERLVEALPELRERLADLVERAPGLACVQLDRGTAARAGEIALRLALPDDLLRFASTARAGMLDLDLLERLSRHHATPKKSRQSKSLARWPCRAKVLS